MNKDFFVFNHQGKADELIKALIRRGWRQVREPEQSQFILSDLDIPPHKKRLENYSKLGIKIVLYPHAGRPNLFHDFPGFAPSESVSVSFVTAQGHIDILQTIHNKHKMEVIGWFLCRMRDFQPRESYKKVIFAPIHPNSDGSLSNVDKKINSDTFKRLIPLAKSGKIDLTLRFVRDLQENGLWKEHEITYVQVEPRVSVAEIDNADLIISHQTFADLANARGTPCIRMGEDIAPRVGSPKKGDFRFAQSWDRYRDLLMYPLDILKEDDILSLFQRAISSDEEIRDWRNRLIGRPFDKNYFVDRLESYL